MKFSSELIENAVNTFARLPGIGRKTALRTVLHLAQKDKALAGDIVESLQKLAEGLTECTICHNLSDGDTCTVCGDASRDKSIICVVAGVRDVMALEETEHYKGLYHVLGGVISPIDGVGPEQLHIEALLERLNSDQVKEVIMAINPTIEGETTIFYISKRINQLERPVGISVLARGISFGGELEYADELTLGRSVTGRIPYRLTEEF